MTMPFLASVCNSRVIINSRRWKWSCIGYSRHCICIDWAISFTGSSKISNFMTIFWKCLKVTWWRYFNMTMASQINKKVSMQMIWPFWILTFLWDSTAIWDRLVTDGQTQWKSGSGGWENISYNLFTCVLVPKWSTVLFFKRFTH